MQSHLIVAEKKRYVKSFCVYGNVRKGPRRGRCTKPTARQFANRKRKIAEMWATVNARRGLADSDIGPSTRRVEAVRDGIRGIRRALERNACRDAEALLKLTDRAVKGVKLVARERDFLELERDRIKLRCRLKR